MRQKVCYRTRIVSEGPSSILAYATGSVLFILLAVPASAQVEPVKLTLSPMPVPSPALKYLLLPELLDQTPGNAALEYYRAFSPEWWRNIREPKLWEKITNAVQTPLKDFPRKELAWLENNQMLRQVDRAARRENVDWGMGERLRRDGYNILLPDIQSLRNIATLLAVRARLEIADGHHDRAVHTLQTGMALAHHTGNGILLIQDLVGMAIAQMMLTQVEELIQLPNAPNLYWALTDLPRPFFDLRKAMQGEKLGLVASIPELRTLETKRLTEEQQQRLLQGLGGGAESLLFERKPDQTSRLVGMALVLRAYPESKKTLIAEGRKPEEVEALPMLQVVLIHSLHQYQRLGDDLFKWFSLPYWEARPRIEKADRRIHQAHQRLQGMPFLDVLPAIQKVIASSARVDRRIAALRCIEAIRLHAAAHEGKMPASLDALTEVPIPLDPMTGKPFTYRVAGEGAMLSAPPPLEEKANSYNSLHYELTIRRKK